MIDYKVSPKAERYFKKLKDKELKKKYHEAIIAIRTDPSVGVPKKGNLKGIIGYDIYHNGVNYEIAYEVIEQEGQLLIIILAGTRENFYDELKIYFKKRMK
jgi:mRNA interferase RelE/StbE